MRLVASEASLVPFGGGPMHVCMAALAFLLQRAGVRLVAALAIAMALVDLSVLPLVAALALRLQRFGAMRQPAMAVGTRRMPFERRRVARVLGVALGAERGPLRRQEKVVWPVTVAAVDPLMQAFVVRGFVVARRAIARTVGGVRRIRVRVVAAGAGAGLAVFRVVRRYVRVATRARGRRGALHVVWVVTVGAFAVRFHPVAAEHQHVLVTVPASHSLVLLEIVRSVATRAFGVPFEQGGLGNPRVLGPMARRAGSARFGGGGVLMRVTRGAGRDDVFAGRGMRGVDFVAVAARRRNRLLLLVRPVAREALLGVVHAHRRDVTLIHRVAARAVAGCEGLDGPLVCSVFRELDAEGMATPAVGGSRRTERLARLVDGVLELALFLVTMRAALGHDGADFGFGELVAVGAGDLLDHHMLVVTIDGARGLPLLRNVDALPVRRSGRYL